MLFSDMQKLQYKVLLNLKGIESNSADVVVASLQSQSFYFVNGRNHSGEK